jgi:hypothetical protein
MTGSQKLERGNISRLPDVNRVLFDPTRERSRTNPNGAYRGVHDFAGNKSGNVVYRDGDSKDTTLDKAHVTIFPSK